MFNLICTIENHVVLPQPIPTDSEQGYVMEDRLQVSVKSVTNDKQYTIEFRIGEGSDAPAKERLNAWMESGETMRVVFSDVVTRPFVHQEGKQYRSRGSVKEVNGQSITLDTVLILAGLSIAPSSDAFDLDAEIRKARGAFKRAQRAYLERQNEAKIAKAKDQMAERIAQIQARRAAQTAETGSTPPDAPASGRRK